MADRIYYVRSQDGCLFESMTKEQILTAIEQAVDSGTITDIDTGFVTKIKEQNAGTGLKFWVGTQAQYNAIAFPENNVFYIISDDTEYDDIMDSIEALSESCVTLNGEVQEVKTKTNFILKELWSGSVSSNNFQGLMVEGLENYSTFLITVSYYTYFCYKIVGSVSSNILGSLSYAEYGSDVIYNSCVQFGIFNNSNPSTINSFNYLFEANGTPPTFGILQKIVGIC